MPSKPTVYRRPPSTARRYAPPPPPGQPAARATAHRRGYTRQWQAARLAHLASHPLCVRCRAAGRVTEATVVDHHVPHRGDPELFWDAANWQSLCVPCHNHKTATEDGAFGRPRKATGG